MLFPIRSAWFEKLPWFCLAELLYRVVTLGAQIMSKGTYGYVIVQGLLLCMVVLVLAIFVKADDLSALSPFGTKSFVNLWRP